MNRNLSHCEESVMSPRMHQGKAGLSEHLHTSAVFFALTQPLDRRSEHEIYGLGDVRHELTLY